MTIASAYIYTIPTGLIVPDTSATLAQVQLEYQNAFGSDLILTPDTSQGVLITTETLARNNFINNNAVVANQINPNYAGGIFFDAIWALTGGQRDASTPTAVATVTVTGIAGTTIPVGSQAATAAGDLFQTTSTVVIGVGGTSTVNFQSVAFGPIPCAAHALNTIVTATVVGWETVDNSNAGVVGTLTQSDQAARASRQNTLFFQGLSLIGAISSAIYAVPGVTSLAILENFNGVPMGMIVSVTNGSTLSATRWGMTTTAGTGLDNSIIVGTDDINFAATAQNLPAINPWPVAKFTTTGNISLSGLATQGGGDWPSTLTSGNIILVKNQTAAEQNGVYVAASGAWSRQAYNLNGSNILGSNEGIQMIRNSVYACVAGGLDTAVTAAMLENKSSGCGWNGNTTVNLIEPASGQIYPVKFDRPEQIGILVNVTVSGCTTTAATNAILDYAAGLISGLKGFVVGADISPFELSGAIMSENPGAYVSSVTISLDILSPSFSTNPIQIGNNQQAFTEFSFITITVV